MTRTLCLLLLGAAVLLAFSARLAGPSAMHRFDQPRTVAYTADIARHGRWLLPRDMEGNPSTKPPLVNWAAAPLLRLGFWHEPAVKFPMLLASLVTVALCFYAGRFFTRGLPGVDAQNSVVLGAVTALAWIGNPANINMIYHARPDPVLVAFLTGAWLSGTRLLADNNRRRDLALIFWLCLGLGALTKGPPALVPLVYVVLAARLLHGRWSILRRLHASWGAPLALGLFLAWLVPLAFFHPDHLRDTLFRGQILAPLFGLGKTFGNPDITSAGPLTILLDLYKNPLWFLQRFVPWSFAAIAGVIVLVRHGGRRHPLAPAALWLAVVLGFFSLVADKTADYILPAYPAAALLAAWWLTRILSRIGLPPIAPVLLAFALVCGFAAETVWFSSAARDPLGEKTKAFAREIRTVTGGGKIVFVRSGYNNLQFLLETNQAGEPTEALLREARWLVAPPQNGATPILLSRELPGVEKSRDNPEGRLALYRR